MGYRLTIWSRKGMLLAGGFRADPAGIREAWRRRPEPHAVGLVSHEAEADPDFPGQDAFRFDRLLITGCARGT